MTDERSLTMRTSTSTQTSPAASATMLRGLRRIRKKAGLTQDEAAAMLGVTRQSYCYWETLRAQPTAKNMIGLMNLFDCSIEDLYREEA